MNAGMKWVRLWHDMPNDPKWRVISRVSGRPISDVIAVYIHLLVCASNATERGRTQANAELFAENLGAALDVDAASVKSIIDAMQGRVLDGERLTGWESRQPQREDNAADRAREWRDKKKTERKRTQTNATEPKSRVEEIKSREEEIQTPAPKAARLIASSDAWFESDFWATWPVKVGKEAAKKAARKVKEPERAAVIDAVRLHTHKILSQDHPIHAATWLNQRRWEDEHVIQGNAKERQLKSVVDRPHKPDTRTDEEIYESDYRTMIDAGESESEARKFADNQRALRTKAA